MTFDENTFNPCDICSEHKCDVCILHMMVEEDLKLGKWIEKVMVEEDLKRGKWIEKEYETYLPVEYDENGDWILHKYTKYICDQCGRVESEKEPYCNCGMRMEVE